MATSSGWAQLGNTIAGGNKLNGELAYDQGQALGARTADALQQARERINKNNALENLDAKLAPYITDPKERAGAVAAAQAGIPLEQLSGFRGQNFTYNQRQVAADPNATDDARAQALFSIGNNDQVVRPVGEFQSTNVLHPSTGVAATALGSQLAGAKLDQQAATTDAARASAGLHREQTAHPEKFRILPPQPGSQGGAGDGSAPIKDETTAQLVAQGLMPAPAPGSRGYLMLGGEEFTKRVNFLAGKQTGAAPAGGAATPAPPAASPAGGAAPALPGAASPAAGGIKLPTETAPPFQANFDANAYGQRRTALNDLARKSGTGGNNDALNRTAGHLDVYEQLLQNSGNTNFKADNALKNWFKNQTGQAYPNNAALAAHVLGTEIVKSMTSIGAGTGEERGGLASAFSNANSPDQAKGAIDTAQRLLREQAVGTNQRVSAAGIKDYYSKYLTPVTRRRLGLDTAPTDVAPPPTGVVPTFKTEQEAEAAGLKPGTKILINGRSATWQ